ncbi:MAG TPA: hypothetical protein VNL72_03495 [Gammaproteobacteria bacterium]|nr:hypothetical protein [Gammaproteobacteria bacterium]
MNHPDKLETFPLMRNLPCNSQLGIRRVQYVWWRRLLGLEGRYLIGFILAGELMPLLSFEVRVKQDHAVRAAKMLQRAIKFGLSHYDDPFVGETSGEAAREETDVATFQIMPHLPSSFRLVVRPVRQVWWRRLLDGEDRYEIGLDTMHSGPHISFELLANREDTARVARTMQAIILAAIVQAREIIEDTDRFFAGLVTTMLGDSNSKSTPSETSDVQSTPSEAPEATASDDPNVARNVTEKPSPTGEHVTNTVTITFKKRQPAPQPGEQPRKYIVGGVILGKPKKKPPSEEGGDS